MAARYQAPLLPIGLGASKPLPASSSAPGDSVHTPYFASARDSLAWEANPPGTIASVLAGFHFNEDWRSAVCAPGGSEAALRSLTSLMPSAPAEKNPAREQNDRRNPEQ